MRLAHLSYCVSGGVYKKLVAQAGAADDLGLDFQFFLITDRDETGSGSLNVARVRLPKNAVAKKIRADFGRYRLLDAHSDLEDYDRIILRYPGAHSFGFGGLFRRYAGKVILEHHTLLADEIRVLERGFLNPLRVFLERSQSPRILSRSAGLIAVTDQIRRNLLDRIARDIPSAVISNGADIESTPLTGFQPLGEGLLVLICVSTTFYPWKGLDRLLAGLVAYEGPRPVHLLVIGDVYLERERELLRRFPTKYVTVHCPGKQYGEELEKSFRSAHLAVSSLALFRKRLEEACPLKTRDYIARGIPFVFGYDDVDLNPVPEFALKIAEDDTPVDMDAVIAFAKRMSRTPGIAEGMRDFGRRRLDHSVKVRQMVDFARLTRKVNRSI